MTKYTEKQVRQAIKYACEYQKTTDYQTAGNILLQEDCTEREIKLLDELAGDSIAANEIELKDIFDA